MTFEIEFQCRNLQKRFEDCMKYGDRMYVKRDIASLGIIYTQEFTDWSTVVTNLIGPPPIKITYPPCWQGGRGGPINFAADNSHLLGNWDSGGNFAGDRLK